jgi:hypothetical protein
MPTRPIASGTAMPNVVSLFGYRESASRERAHLAEMLALRHTMDALNEELNRTLDLFLQQAGGKGETDDDPRPPAADH